MSEDVSACEDCSCEGVPVSVGYRRSFDLGGSSVACPLVGGSAGFEASVAVDGQLTPAHCGNGCAGAMTLGGTLSATLNLCSDALTLSGEAAARGTSRQCIACDEATCSQHCAGGTCETASFGGEAGLSYTRFYGYQVSRKSGPVSAAFKCGASLTGAPSVGVSGSRTEDQGFSCPGGDCEACLSATGQAGFGVSGSVDCYVSLDLWDGFFSTSLGCQGCGSLGVNAYAGVGGQTGECGGSLCAFAGAGVEASASTPCISAAVGWFGFSARCSLTASACAEANACGSCSCDGCGSASTSLSCSVNTGGTCD